MSHTPKILLVTLIAIIILLSSCGTSKADSRDAFGGLNFSSVETTPDDMKTAGAEVAGSGGTDIPDSSGSSDSGDDLHSWRNNPYYIEYNSMDTSERARWESDKMREYLERLGIGEYYGFRSYTNFFTGEELFPGSFGTSFLDEKTYRYQFEYFDEELHAMLIETNGDSKISVKFEIELEDPITGEKKTDGFTVENGEGEKGIAAIYKIPGDGFYIKKSSASLTVDGKEIPASTYSDTSEFIDRAQKLIEKKFSYFGTPYVNLRYEKMKLENPGKKIVLWFGDSSLQAFDPGDSEEINKILEGMGKDYLVCFASAGSDAADKIVNESEFFDEIDILSTGAGSNYTEFVKEGKFLPIKDLLYGDPRGEKYLSTLPKNYIDTLTVGGDIYAISPGISNILPGLGYCVNKELAEKYGWDIDKPAFEQTEIIKEIEEKENCATAVVSGMKNLGAMYYPNGLCDIPGAYYDPNTGRADIITKDPDYIYLEKNLAAIYEAGVSDGSELISKGLKNEIFLSFGRSSSPHRRGEILKMECNLIPGEFYDMIDLRSEPKIRQASKGTGIGSGCDCIDEAFDFLILSQTDGEIAKITVLSESVPSNSVLTNGCSANIFLPEFSEYFPEGFAEDLREFFEASSLPAALGFIFDGTGIKEFEAVKAASESEDFISAPFDETSKNLEEELKEAGIDTLIDEINRQLEEWKNTK